jgi:hypothetical protein
MIAKDITGQKYGMLTALFMSRKERRPNGDSCRLWKCKCDCGNEIEVPVGALTSGNTKTCGCTSKAKTHGMGNSRIYQIWADMKVRCDNPDNQSYHYYGGKGVSYDPAWSKFENFYEEMKDGYSEELTLDRIDHCGNYEKSNCRWLSKTAQSRNRGMCSTNKTGVTGVRTWHDKKNGTKYYVAGCKSHITRKMIERHFSVNKYGEELAFFAACECRELLITRLNLQGAGYSQNHGK